MKSARRITIEQLETDVLSLILAQAGLRNPLPDDPSIYMSAVEERNFTGVGVITSYVRERQWTVSNTDDNRGVGDVVVILNGTIEAGFLLMIEKGRVTWLEGYVFGDDRWPDEILTFEIR